MLNNSTFYPTPPDLAARMIKKINTEGCNVWEMNVLEPSAGKGDLIKSLNKGRWDGFSGNGTFRDISAIEIDPDLRATLRGKGIKVIDSDFLAYSGPDKFDLIIANPPFDNGDKHLLKAIDILYRGQIIFLLNAETIRNPYTNTRKKLAKKLKELDADVEFIKNGFMADAERKSEVEVALVSINLERYVEDDLFAGADDKVQEEDHQVDGDYPLSTGRKVEELVAEYNQIVRLGTDTIVSYYQNYRKVGKYIGLNEEPDGYHSGEKDLTAIMQGTLNKTLILIRRDFWRRTLDLREVQSRMTRVKRSEFEHQLQKRCDMDFTEKNIRSFVLNLIGGYEQMLTESVLALFDKFTIRHCYDDGLITENIHYFNGWKTNDAFKVGKKVIIPIYASYSDRGPFVNDYSGKWELHHSAIGELHDIDIVMNYFDGMSHYYSICEALQHSFVRGESRKIESTYFTITTYKKGTIHLTFNDEGILRRFNVAACKGKGWLPCDYGKKGFDELPMAEKDVIESFEGRRSYTLNRKQPIFARNSSLLQLEEMNKTQTSMF